MKKLIIGLLVLFSGLQLFLLPPVLVGATPKDSVCEGVKLTGGDCDVSAEGTVSGILKTAIQLLSLLVGVASVIMIIIGGFKYIISSGDSNSVNSAKNTILFAVIGLVIVAMAQIIVIFVLNRAVPKTGQSAGQGIGQQVTPQTP